MCSLSRRLVASVAFVTLPHAGEDLPEPSPGEPVASRAALDNTGPTSKRRILGWAMWDWGTQPFNTVITTFVFSQYIVNEVFGSPNFTSRALGIATLLSGLCIALMAPVLGQSADRAGNTVRVLKGLTWALAVLSAALFFVRPEKPYFWLGLVLFAVGTLVSEIAAVNYYATMDQVANQANVGRVSGIGWGMGYLGGIVILVLILFGFILPEVGLFGVTGTDALDVRASMLLCGLWVLLFTIPTWFVVRDRAPDGPVPKVGVAQSYRLLWQSLSGLWRTSRHTVYFLLASALFRDGLAAVFTFGAVIAAQSFGMPFTDVVIFGIAANIVAGLATMAIGTLDDRLGPKTVILFSLIALVILGSLIFVLHSGGTTVFWVLGLLMTLFVGPAQAASRSFLARLIPEGKSGEIFGLYATTGRAVSFVAPAMFTLFVTIGAWVTGGDNTVYWGIIGIVLVLAAGAAVMLPVHDPSKHSLR